MIDNILFKDRKDALDKLIDILPIEKMKLEEWLVLSISAGSVPIAVGLSKKLNAAFDFMFTEKVFAPYNDECEIAIVTETEEVVIHEELVKSFGINLDFIFSEANKIYKDKILGYIYRYRAGEPICDLNNKNVLLVDEGLNTGLTMMACIKTAINLGAKSVSVAVPLLPEATAHNIESIADDLYYVHSLPHFVTIDFYYQTLENIDLNSVKKIINQ